MTVTRHDTVEVTERENFPSPGLRLREARTMAKLTLADVEARLHLHRKVLQALEEDDYDHLPESMFVRGYLRGYARLLNLPPGPIVEAYERQGTHEPHLVPDIASRPQAKSGDFPVRMATYLVVALLITLTVLWWRGQNAPVTGTLPLDQAAPGISGAAPAEVPEPRAEDDFYPPQDSDDAAVLDEEPSTPTAREAEMAAEDGPASVGEATGAVTGPDAEAAAAAPASSPPVSAPTETALAPPAPAPPPEARAGSTAESRTSTSAAGARDELAIHLGHDAWVEIYDRGGRRLYFNLAKAGKTVSVHGRGPMRVLLGYARGARVEYNGELFDQAPYTSKDVARFTVGARR